MILTLATVTIGLAAAIRCATVGVVALIAHVLNAIDVNDDNGDDQGDDRGHGGCRRPDEPEPPGGGGEPGPDSWPDFEAQLADYVASRRQ